MQLKKSKQLFEIACPLRIIHKRTLLTTITVTTQVSDPRGMAKKKLWVSPISFVLPDASTRFFFLLSLLSLPTNHGIYIWTVRSELIFFFAFHNWFKRVYGYGR